MVTAFESLVQFFETDELTHETRPEQRLVIAGFRGEKANIQAYFTVDEEQSIFQIFATIPVKVPEGARRAIAETVVRANFGMKLGGFEMDFRDGELRFHVGTTYVDTLDYATIRRLLGTVFHCIDRYFPAFMAVIYANELPEDAVRHAEQDLNHAAEDPENPDF